MRAAQATQADYIRSAASIIGKNCSLNGVRCANSVLAQADEAGEGKGDEMTVCLSPNVHELDETKKICYPAIIYGYGAGHAAAEWLYYQGRVIKEVAPSYVHLIGRWGLFFEEDIRFAEQYFEDILDNVTCGDGVVLGFAYDEKKSSNCVNEMSALLGLAMIARNKENAREKIEKVLNDYWDSSDGAIVIKSAIPALASLGTEKAWQSLDKFLTSTSISMDVMDVLYAGAPSFWVEHGYQQLIESGGRAFKYHNKDVQFNERDGIACQVFGYKNWTIDTPEQYPQRNIFEDIGYMLVRAGIENKDPFARKLAQKIMDSAIAYAKHPTTKVRHVVGVGAEYESEEMFTYKGHWTLVMGILRGILDRGNLDLFVSDKEGLKTMLELMSTRNEFWDINAGTQLRIWNTAAQFNKLLGTHFEGADQSSEVYKMKATHYNKLEDSRFAGEMANGVAMVFTFTSLGAAVPSLARGLWSGAQSIMKVFGRSGTNAVGFISKMRKISQVLKSSFKKGIREEGGVAKEAEDVAGFAKDVTKEQNSLTPAQHLYKSFEKPQGTNPSQIPQDLYGGDIPVSDVPAGNYSLPRGVDETTPLQTSNPVQAVQQSAVIDPLNSVINDAKVVDSGVKSTVGRMWKNFSWKRKVLARAYYNGTKNMLSSGLPIPSELNMEAAEIELLVEQIGVDAGSIIRVDGNIVEYMANGARLSKKVELMPGQVEKLNALAKANRSRMSIPEADLPASKVNSSSVPVDPRWERLPRSIEKFAGKNREQGLIQEARSLAGKVSQDTRPLQNIEDLLKNKIVAAEEAAGRLSMSDDVARIYKSISRSDQVTAATEVTQKLENALSGIERTIDKIAADLQDCRSVEELNEVAHQLHTDLSSYIEAVEGTPSTEGILTEFKQTMNAVENLVKERSAQISRLTNGPDLYSYKNAFQPVEDEISNYLGAKYRVESSVSNFLNKAKDIRNELRVLFL